MTTLAQINDTLVDQGETLKDTNDSIKNLVGKISSQMEADETARLRGLEDKRESAKKARVVKRDNPTSFKSGLMQGSGLGGMMNVLGDILGKGGSAAGLLGGALGLAFGKLIKGGLLVAVSGIIGQYFSDEIMSFVKNTFDKDGDGKVSLLGKEFDLNDPLVQAAITTAIPLLGLIAVKRIAIPLAMAAIGWIGGQILALGAAGLATLFTKAGFPTIASLFDSEDTKKTGRKESGRNRKARANQRTIRKIRAGKVPGLEMNKGGQIKDTKTGKFVSREDALKRAKNGGKLPAAKPGGAPKADGKKFKLPGKFGIMSKVLGPLALGAVAYQAYDIITDEELKNKPKEKKARLAGVLGSGLGGVGGATIGAMLGTAAFPGVGTLAGGVLGGVLGSLSGDLVGQVVARWLLGEDQAPLPATAIDKFNAERDKRQMANAKLSSSMFGERQVNIMAGDETNSLDALAAQNATFGITPSAQLAPRTPKLSENTQDLITANSIPTIEKDIAALGASINQLAASVMSSSGGSSNTTITNNSGIVMPRGSTVNLLDGGLALGAK